MWVPSIVNSSYVKKEHFFVELIAETYFQYNR